MATFVTYWRFGSSNAQKDCFPKFIINTPIVFVYEIDMNESSSISSQKQCHSFLIQSFQIQLVFVVFR